MSRIEGKIVGKGKEPVDGSDILAALANEVADPDERRDAVSRYLSASEGWREASSVLGGAFARAEPWLETKKDG